MWICHSHSFNFHSTQDQQLSNTTDIRIFFPKDSYIEKNYKHVLPLVKIDYDPKALKQYTQSNKTTRHTILATITGEEKQLESGDVKSYWNSEEVEGFVVGFKKFRYLVNVHNGQ